jgi:hypothetical protein
MEGLIFGGVATLFVGLFVLIVVVSIRQDKKRSEALIALAQTLGFTYEKKLSGTTQIPCSGASLFNRGHGRYAKNYMTGTVADIQVILTDYQYTTGSGKNSTTHSLTLTAYNVPGLTLPDFTLEKENFLTRIADKFGFGDIDFDTHPVFSDKYQLKGKDEPAIRALFTPTLLTAIENGLINNAWHVQAGDNWLIIHTTRLKPEQWQDFLNSSFELMNKLTVEAMA